MLQQIKTNKPVHNKDHKLDFSSKQQS